MSHLRQRAAAIQAGQRMVSRGERPLYRIRVGQDGRWTVEGYPWLALDAVTRYEALAAARAAVAAMLEIEPDGFDVES